MTAWPHFAGRPSPIRSDTDGLTAPQVADTIARLAGLTVLPDTDGPLRAALRRYGTTARNVRIR